MPGSHRAGQIPADDAPPEPNRYRLAGPHWEIYGDPDPSTGHFDVEVFWSLVAP
jgi:hypothetical protein